MSNYLLKTLSLHLLTTLLTQNINFEKYNWKEKEEQEELSIADRNHGSLQGADRVLIYPS